MRDRDSNAPTTPAGDVSRSQALAALAPAPQPGVTAPSPADRLPRRLLGREELLVPLWWVGAHGGAGESTLEQLIPRTRASGHSWLVSPAPERPTRTLLVARTHYTGLIVAQRALRDWASGAVATQLEGLVLIADAPGKLPPELRALVDLVQSAAPGRTWRIPWQPEWRLGQVTLEHAPAQAQQLVEHLEEKEP